MEPMVGVGKRLAEMLLKKRETVRIKAFNLLCSMHSLIHSYSKLCRCITLHAHNQLFHILEINLNCHSCSQLIYIQLAQKGSLQIGRVLARYDTKTPLEEVETPFDHPEEQDEEITTDKIDFRLE